MTNTEIINQFYKHLNGRSPMQAMIEELETLPEFSNHCSDLYVKQTPEATEFLEKHKLFDTISCLGFISNIDHKLWYDLAFMYHEYHHNKKEPI